VGQSHNGLERAGALTSALKDALGATDAEGGLERFGETMTPVIDLWRQPEWALLRDELPWAFTLTQPAVAAEFSAVGIVNPVGSRKLLVVDMLCYRSLATQGINSGWATSAVILSTLASSQAVLTRDLRANPQVAAALVAFGSDAAIGSIITQTLEADSVAAAAANQLGHVTPVILPPGFGFAAVGTTVNSNIVVTMAGRERPVFPAELG